MMFESYVNLNLESKTKKIDEYFLFYHKVVLELMNQLFNTYFPFRWYVSLGQR